MEKTYQMDNVDVNSLHDKIVSELQNQGFEIHRDEPRDNGFKIFVRRGEEHGEVEVFNDWGTVRLITHGRLEWELMNIVEPLIQQPSQQTPTAYTQPRPMMPQQPFTQPPMPQPPTQMPRPMTPPTQPSMPQQPFMPQQPTAPTAFQQPAMQEHQQLLNALMQSGYQIEVNTVNGQIFFIRGRKGNYVIDIEGRPQP